MASEAPVKHNEQYRYLGVMKVSHELGQDFKDERTRRTASTYLSKLGQMHLLTSLQVAMSVTLPSGIAQPESKRGVPHT